LDVARSWAEPILRLESDGTTITRVFESRILRVPWSTRPLFWRASIFASSAEMKRSAGAPSWICLARALEAPRLSRTLSPLSRS
jgi:hypothetical protein